MDRGAWRATVHGITKGWGNWANEHTRTHTHTYPISFCIILLLLLLALPCSLQNLSSLTRDWTCAPAVEAWSPNHWTASECPHLSLLEFPGCLLSFWRDLLGHIAATTAASQSPALRALGPPLSSARQLGQVAIHPEFLDLNKQQAPL